MSHQSVLNYLPVHAPLVSFELLTCPVSTVLNYLHAPSVSTELVKWNLQYWFTYMPPSFGTELLTCLHCSVLNYSHAPIVQFWITYMPNSQYWFTYMPPLFGTELLTSLHRSLLSYSPSITNFIHYKERCVQILQQRPLLDIFTKNLVDGIVQSIENTGQN